jgi:hypothetical protein
MKITSNQVLAAIAATFCSLSLAIFNIANAENMSKNRYQALYKNLGIEYESAKARCEPLVNFARELCTTKAEGARDIKRAVLEANYKPTIQNRYNANMIAASATYTIATKECESMKNTEEEICMKNTKDSYLLATSNARLQRNSEKADEIKKDKTAEIDRFPYQDNSFIEDVFNNIYHVKA